MTAENAPADRTLITQFGHLTSPEARAARERGALLILPVGALEQHGDGLPLSTDNIRADFTAERLANNLIGRAFVLPTVNYGVSPHHSRFPGTVSLPPQLFIELVTTIVRSLADDGWARLLVITGHGGNGAALGVIQQDLLRTHPEFHFAWSGVSTLAVEATRKLDTTEVSGHSGESETAQLLAIDQSLVAASLLNPGATTLEGLSPKSRLSRTKSPSLAVRFDEYADNGVLGNPRTATVGQGEEILTEAVSALTEYAKTMLEL